MGPPKAPISKLAQNAAKKTPSTGRMSLPSQKMPVRGKASSRPTAAPGSAFPPIPPLPKRSVPVKQQSLHIGDVSRADEGTAGPAGDGANSGRLSVQKEAGPSVKDDLREFRNLQSLVV